MIPTPVGLSTLNQGRFLGAATIERIDPEDGTIALSMERDGAMAHARSTVGQSVRLGTGDIVLAIGNELHDMFVIGLLNSVQVKANEQRQPLVVTRDPVTGRNCVEFESGDLDFVVRNGGVHFVSTGDFSVTSIRKITMRSKLGIQLGVSNIFSQVKSLLNMQAGRTDLTTAELNLKAVQGNADVGEAKLSSKRVSAKVDNVKLDLGRLQTTVDLIISKAKNAYTTVAELFQIRAGRSRPVVDTTSHMKAQSVRVRAVEDFKINSDKIHLG